MNLAVSLVNWHPLFPWTLLINYASTGHFLGFKSSLLALSFCDNSYVAVFSSWHRHLSRSL
jgi:hypothetical protein